MHRASPLLLALLGCGTAERPGVPPRHLLLITVEGLRPDHTSAWMYERPTTAIEAAQVDRQRGRGLGFDDLVGDGVQFQNAFTADADPTASLRALFSGSAAPTAAPDLAQRLASTGMRGLAFVHTEAPLPDGLVEGFERVEHCASDLDVLRAVLPLYKSQDWGDGQRLFLWVHLSGPAFPIEPAPAVADFHLMETEGVRSVDCSSLFLRGPAPGQGGTSEIDGGEAARAARFAAGGPSTADLRRIVDLYDGSVHELAQHLWTLVGFFAFETKGEGAFDETLLAFAGVNGLELTRSGVPWGEHAPHDSSLHVPLFLRHPDSLTGRRVLSSVVETTDLAPTLLEWFEAERAPGREGSSLLGLTDHRPRTSFVETPARSRVGGALTVRDRRWRLVRTAEGTEQLFDTALDPRELHCRAEQEPQVLETLRRALAEESP